MPAPNVRCSTPAVIIAWVAGLMTPFFLVLHKLGLMRVSAGVRSVTM